MIQSDQLHFDQVEIAIAITAVRLFPILSELFEEKIVENHVLSELDVCAQHGSYQCEHSPDFSRIASVHAGPIALAACLLLGAFRFHFLF